MTITYDGLLKFLAVFAILPMIVAAWGLLIMIMKDLWNEWREEHGH